MMGQGSMKERQSEIGPADIKGLLARVIGKKKWQRRMELHGVFRHWNEVVGPDISMRAQPAYLRGTVLWVEVSDSIWMQQLHLQKLLLLDLITRRLGTDGITDIRFRLNCKLGCATKAAPAPRQVRPVDPRKLAEFEQHLALLRDEEVKNSLRRLWTRYHINPLNRSP
jgi:hypothetical protein